MAGAQLTFSGSFMAGLHFPAVFLPPSAFSEQTALSGDFAAWGEPILQWVAAINGADVRKQPVSYPGNPSALPGLCWVRGTYSSLDSATATQIRAGATAWGLPSTGATRQRGFSSSR